MMKEDQGEEILPAFPSFFSSFPEVAARTSFSEDLARPGQILRPGSRSWNRSSKGESLREEERARERFPSDGRSYQVPISVLKQKLRWNEREREKEDDADVDILQKLVFLVACSARPKSCLAQYARRVYESVLLG